MVYLSLLMFINGTNIFFAHIIDISGSFKTVIMENKVINFTVK